MSYTGKSNKQGIIVLLSKFGGLETQTEYLANIFMKNLKIQYMALPKKYGLKKYLVQLS